MSPISTSELMQEDGTSRILLEDGLTGILLSNSDAPSPPTGGSLDPLGAVARVFIDGAEVTGCVQTGSITPRLNRPRQATLRMFTDCAIGTPCSRVKIYLYDDLWFHGFVTQISTEAGEDGNLMSEYTCHDPMWLWQMRPARSGPDSSDPGDFSQPELFKDPSVYGPEILNQVLLQSEDDSDPEFGEGPLFIDLPGAGVAAGVVNLSGAPVDYPMTIAEVFELLSSTGVVDAVLTPIDSGDNMAHLNIYNGDYGTDRSGSVAFEYGTGAHNVRSVRMTEDSSNVCNKLWYFLGPRVATAGDPDKLQHWQTNITADRPGIQALDAYDDFLALREASRDSCGVRMEVRIYDAQGEDTDDFGPATFAKLYERLWFMESWLRTQSRTLIHVTPVRESGAMQLPPGVSPVGIGAFDIGDLVTVTAGPVVRGGFSGAQRIYEFTVSWDEDGIIETGELLTSSDGEGAT